MMKLLHTHRQAWGSFHLTMNILKLSTCTKRLVIFVTEITQSPLPQG